MLRAIAEGSRPWQSLVAHPSWERTVDLAAALGRGRPARFPSLNLPNRGQIPGLPEGALVETAAEADASGIRPVSTTLPPGPLAMCQGTAAVHSALVRACLSRSRSGLIGALALDPTIRDPEAALRAVDACLAAHADLVPAFG